MFLSIAQLKMPACWLCLTSLAYTEHMRNICARIESSLFLSLCFCIYKGKNLDLKLWRLLSLPSTWTNPKPRHMLHQHEFSWKGMKNWKMSLHRVITTRRNTYGRTTWSDHFGVIKGDTSELSSEGGDYSNIQLISRVGDKRSHSLNYWLKWCF